MPGLVPFLELPALHPILAVSDIGHIYNHLAYREDLIDIVVAVRDLIYRFRDRFSVGFALDRDTCDNGSIVNVSFRNP